MIASIKSDLEYRVGYEYLSILIEADRMAGCADPEKLRTLIAETKRKLRSYAHRGNAVDVGLGFTVERRIVCDRGMDGYVELVSIPDVFDTEEDADEFFRDFLEIRCTPSMYDCTGQAFTSWYKLFQRNGQFWAYHSVCFDV